jgi:hypothetical protein
VNLAKIALAKGSEHSYLKKPHKRSKANVVISKNYISKAKMNRITPKLSNSEAKWSDLKFDNIEAKRTGSIKILYLKQQKNEPSLFLRKKAKKWKGSIVNYQSFAIPFKDKSIVSTVTKTSSLSWKVHT